MKPTKAKPPAPKAPVFTTDLPDLISLRDNYRNGVIGLEQQIAKLSEDRTATNGAIQLLDAQINAMEQKKAGKSPVLAPVVPITDQK